MHVVFHFDSKHPVLALGWNYAHPVISKVFGCLLNIDVRHVRSVVFAGDVLNLFGCPTDRRAAILAAWEAASWSVWRRTHRENLDRQDTVIFAVRFGNISREIADRLHNVLLEYPSYMGALEVDRDDPVLDGIYALPARYRLIGREIRILFAFDDPDILEAEILYPLPFESVRYEMVFNDSSDEKNEGDLAPDVDLTPLLLKQASAKELEGKVDIRAARAWLAALRLCDEFGEMKGGGTPHVDRGIRALLGRMAGDP